MQTFRLTLSVVVVSSSLVAGARAADPAADPYLWLEQVDSDTALAWVRAHNEPTLATLESDPRYQTFYDDVEAIVNASDRIPDGRHRDGRMYNFWQDADHVRGLWRRCPLASYRTDDPEWETLIDLDALSEAEGENWVFHGVTPLEPDDDRVLVELSRGGKDAGVLRELDLKTKSFVEDGFSLPEAKSGAQWLDRDDLLVCTDFGEGTVTTSGYPRIVKRWRRGTPLADAEKIFECEANDVGAWPWCASREDGSITAVSRSITAFEHELYVWDGKGLRLLPVPRTAETAGAFAGRILFTAKEDWERPGAKTVPTGALFAVDVKRFLATGELPEPEIVFQPDEHTTISRVSTSRSAVWLALLRDVRGELRRATLDPESGWSSEPVALPDNGTVGIMSTDDYDDTVFVTYQSFLVPSQILQVDPETLSATVVKTSPERFDASGDVVEQLFAVSTDGTRIPYFLVRPRDLPFDGSTPTILYGYGGFEISQTPVYIASWGKLWLERGGAYAIANIRGGGEYGPRWHLAALKEKRQVSFDDFHSVARDLIARKVTDTDHLGIMGGSQGGLLVGVAFTQHPELYAATVCQVPLLDMLRYHLLPPGASWMGEYGDPDDPEMRKAIAAYSPYQNLKPGVTYRNVYFETSTKDDRVHPGHARKMVARMEALGQHPLFYENIEGGHAAGANQNQRARRIALEFVHMSRSLGLK